MTEVLGHDFPILIVSSNPEDTLRYKEGAKLYGRPTITTDSLSDVDRLLEASPPAAIILDRMVGGQNSMVSLAALRERPDMDSVPIIVVLEGRDPHDIHDAYECGADAAMQVPVDPAQLREILVEVSKPEESD